MEKMSKIYLIMGHTGEHGDACEWPVQAFHREVDCQQMVSAMNSYLSEAIATGVKEYSWNDLYFSSHRLTKGGKILPERELMDEIESHMREHYDPHFKMDYTGTDYSYIEIPAKLRG